MRRLSLLTALTVSGLCVLAWWGLRRIDQRAEVWPENVRWM